ncbi:uncharacterized protein LOC103026840 isoform X2 [Astyanax mexicanus]|uniref:uncharacterized protein LOC103026840 isoform X2 n=1 Tax=Astyanax mexicanus TaxID=7994 RepID=UPI0020CAA7B6|nr:uncharacterized protein LOC103026840 isoform X2 [Astyanax mexicanus]
MVIIAALILTESAASFPCSGVFWLKTAFLFMYIFLSPTERAFICYYCSSRAERVSIRDPKTCWKEQITEKEATMKMAEYTQKCTVPGCDGDVGTFHTLPKEPNCQRAWLMFIYNKIPHTFNSKLLVCSAHFTPDSFSNLVQYRSGFAQRLTLERGAIPTLLEPKPRPSQSRQAPIRNDVGCQTDAPSIASQSTQLSLKTLSPHVRSKGTSPSQAKRPCLECEEEKDEAEDEAEKKVKMEMEEGLVKEVKVKVEYEAEDEVEVEVEDSFTGYTDPPDLTHDPAQSGTDEEESSQLAGTSGSSNGDAKFIVFEQCLLSLFEHCPVCTGFCNVRPRKRGNILTVEQLCHHCEFFRMWRSQPVVGNPEQSSSNDP